MTIFDLPTGNFELQMKPKGRGRYKAEWQSVMMTDLLTADMIAECVEQWSVKNKVTGARFNGREVTIPTKYHWELRDKDKVLGKYKTRAEAKAEWEERRRSNRGKDKAEWIPTGTIHLVETL